MKLFTGRVKEFNVKVNFHFGIGEKSPGDEGAQ